MMINKMTIIETESLNPYKNLALEEYLLNITSKNEIVLYLWQNQNTVVIGRNQDCYCECLVDKLESENGFLARRLSGGGAVYHDVGNLNFTFITSKENHDVSKQTDVILHAVNALNLDEKAIKSGRNDLTIDGKKFSGNAYYNGAENAYHHGTIMLHADIDNLSHYLNVQRDKLQSKGVASVRSRVTNICDHILDGAEATVDIMMKNLISSLAYVYDLSLENDAEYKEIGNTQELRELTNKYSSSTWKYNISGKDNPQMDIKDRFEWGGINIRIWMDNATDTIRDCKIYSDAMDVEWISKLPLEFIGKKIDGISLTGIYGKDILELLKKSMN